MQNGRPDFLEKIIESEQIKKKIGIVDNVKEIDEGLNSIFLLEASERYILKVHTIPRNDVEWFRAEPLIYSRLENLEIPSPEIILSELSEEHHENAFFIMEEMPGVNPAAFKEDVSFQALKSIVNQFGRFLGEIHEGYEIDDYGMLGGFDGEISGIESPEKWTWAVKGAVDELEDLIEDGWDADIDPSFTSEEEIYETLPENPDSVLLHLDNRLDNLLVDADQVTAFLDWSHPEAGHYEYDLVRAEYLLIDMDLDFFEEEKRDKLSKVLYEGYESVSSVNKDDFEDRREIYRKITLMWVLAGFPNWKSKLDEDERKQKKKYLVEKAEREL